MIRLKKNILAMILAVTTIFTVVGCTSNNNGGSNGEGATTTVTEDGTIDTSKFVTVKLIVLGNKPTKTAGCAEL